MKQDEEFWAELIERTFLLHKFSVHQLCIIIIIIIIINIFIIIVVVIIVIIIIVYCIVVNNSSQKYTFLLLIWNLLLITLKFYVVTIFLLVYFQAAFLYVVCRYRLSIALLNLTFLAPAAYCRSLWQRNAMKKLQNAAIFLYYIGKNVTLRQVRYFSKLYCHNSLQDSKLVDLVTLQHNKFACQSYCCFWPLEISKYGIRMVPVAVIFKSRFI